MEYHHGTIGRQQIVIIKMIINIYYCARSGSAGASGAHTRAIQLSHESNMDPFVRLFVCVRVCEWAQCPRKHHKFIQFI